MKIRLLSLYAGPIGCFNPDQIVEFCDEEAAVLIEAGYAVSLEPAACENAAKEFEAENASIDIKPKGRKK